MSDIPKSIKHNILFNYREVERSLDSYEQSIESQRVYLNDLQREKDKLVVQKNEMSLFMLKNGISAND